MNGQSRLLDQTNSTSRAVSASVAVSASPRCNENKIAENQNFLFLRAGSCVEITHMRPDVNLRSEFRRFQIAGDGIAINPFRFHPEIIKFSGLIDWWIELAAHVEHAVDRLVRASEDLVPASSRCARKAGDRRSSNVRRSSASRF